MIKGGLETSKKRNLFLAGSGGANDGGLLFQWSNTSLPTPASGDRAIGWEGTTLKKWNGTAWSEIAGSSTSGSLDNSYDDGAVITVDAGAVTLNASGGYAALALTKSDTGAQNVMTIETASATAPLSITSTHADAVGPIIYVYHNSASQADADVVGELQFWGNDDGGTPSANEYCTIQAVATDSGATSEDGTLNFLCTVAGTQRTLLSLANDTATVGTGAADAYISSSGAHNLVLETNSGTNSGTITITDAANGDIEIDCNGTGDLTLPNTGIVQGGTTATRCTFAVAGTSGDGFKVSTATITSGNVFTIDHTASATLSGGKLISAEVDSSAVFTVAEDGAVVITGTAGGTDALTLTTGDLLLNDSDQNIIESENGTSTLLLLDNKAGAVGSGASVLKIDAGGVVNAAGFGLDVVFTGSAAAGSTVARFTPVAGCVGVNINGAGLDTREALIVDADPTGAYDVARFNCDSVIAADQAVIQVVTTGAIAAGGTAMRFDVTGTPDADARILEFDLAAVTDTNEPYAIFIDAGGKKVRALHIDADPVTNDVAYIHTDAAIANNKALLHIDNAGAPANTGSNDLRVIFSGTDTNKHDMVEFNAGGKDCRALTIDADPTTKDVVTIHTDAVIADNKAALSIDCAGAAASGSSLLRLAHTGTPANAASYTLEIDNSGMDSSNNPVCIRVNHDDGTGAVFQATSGGAAAPMLDLYNTNTGATGVVIKTTHTSTGSAAANDVVLSIQAWGLDNGDASEEYGRIEVQATNVTGTSEASVIKHYVTVGGTSEVSTTMKTDGLLVGSGADHAVIHGSGAYNLTIATNAAAANEPSIALTDGATGNVTITAGGTSGEIDLASPVLHSSTQSLSGAGAVDLVSSITEVTTTSTDALTLADGVEGQLKFITMISDGGEGTLTPDNLAGYTTIKFNDVGDSCTLLFTNGTWCVVGQIGCTIA